MSDSDEYEPINGSRAKFSVKRFSFPVLGYAAFVSFSWIRNSCEETFTLVVVPVRMQVSSFLKLSVISRPCEVIRTQYHVITVPPCSGSCAGSVWIVYKA